MVSKPVERKKPRVTAKMPSYVSGQEMIHILEEKKTEKKKRKLLRSKGRLKGKLKDYNQNERKR